MKGNEIKEKLKLTRNYVLFSPYFYKSEKQAARHLACYLNIKYTSALAFVRRIPKPIVFGNYIVFNFASLQKKENDWFSYFGITPDIFIFDDDYKFYRDLEFVKGLYKNNKVTSGDN